jgi:hypothetical protein
LRANKRIKDGKEHRYWSVVENRRVAGGRSVQKTLFYLGEINDSDRYAWTSPKTARPIPGSNIQRFNFASTKSNWLIHGNGELASLL